eukprot:XP_019920296.1 PREDICTED: beclin-1-like [Crassostrea gigas]
MATIKVESKSGTTHVSFVCQRCRQPLKLDHSFNTLDRQLLAELSAPFTAVESNEDELDIISKPALDDVEVDENYSKRDITSTPEPDEDAGDFLLLGETSPGNMDNLSHRIRRPASESPRLSVSQKNKVSVSLSVSRPS